MMIDEAIEKARNNAVIQRNNQKLNYMLGKSSPYYNLNCDKYAEYHEQIAEWLEELKMLRELKAEHRKIGNIKGFNKGYNKAIDDFIHECDKCCGFYTGNNKNLTREDMLNIAEQLKAGDMDEEDFENACCDGKCRICEKCEEVSDER